MGLNDSVPAVAEIKNAAPVRFGFENTYARLPERFFGRVAPTRVAAPKLIKVNATLAADLGLDPAALASEQGVAILAGNVVAEGSEPLAMGYAGHQFGHFVPQLGDGRAKLLGEVVGRDGVQYDIQLKGSGRTAYSRGGDGRAWLGPVLREYVVSEAMAALGVPTTRALAAVATGEPVYRESALPGAVLTRVASSHLRVGTFQFFAAKGDVEGLKILADYAIQRHYPGAAATEKPYRALLDEVIGRHARLVAQWMLLGFIHGVMNTDNTSISGETLDYGPCAFMEAYEPGKVFSSIDRQGRYAFSNQPNAAHWNLTRLAEAMLPLLHLEEGSQEAALEAAYAALAQFAPLYETERLAGLRKKLGLMIEHDGDAALAEGLLACMAANGADFTLTFRRLCDAAHGDEGVRDLFASPKAFDEWAGDWKRRLVPASEPHMRSVNPLYIPRNHQVEAMIESAVERHDLRIFEELLEVTSRPFDERKGLERYALQALPEECVSQTFCGT